MRVKICGITTPDDARAAADAGADAIGLNFVGGPRQIDTARAERILRALPPMMTPVALVRLVAGGRIPDPPLTLLNRCRVSHVQLYGDVQPERLADLVRDGFRPMPVLAVRDEGFADRMADGLHDGSAGGPACVVLDAFNPAHEGGTGQTFCWAWVSAARRAGQLKGWPPIILAGGLNPDNVAEAVRIVQPFGVDVSSGVEVDGAPGRKDPDKMRQFVHNARHASAAARGA